jgi:transposase InsO family protein
MGLEHQHSRDALTGHGRLERAPAVLETARAAGSAPSPNSFRRCYGSSYISADMAKWLDGQNMEHLRGAPYHPMTQGKIERWHQTLKNRILLENYYLPGDLETQIEAFVADYNHLRYHESIANLTPADVYFGRGQTILIARERIKRQPPLAAPSESRIILQTRGARDSLILSRSLSQKL